MPPDVSDTYKKATWLPLCFGLITGIGVLVVYAIAVIQKDVSPFLPFISDAAGYLPQSGLFSITLFYATLLGYWTLYVRYSAVRQMNQQTCKKIDFLNKLSFVIGLVSFCGLPILAAYPVTTIILAHNIGAYLFFIGGTIYIILQTILTYFMHPYFNGKSICRIRLTFCIIECLSLAAMIISEVLDAVNDETYNVDKLLQGKQKQEVDPLASTISEWILCLAMMLYYFTFIREFQKIHMKIQVQCMVSHFDDDVNLLQFSTSQESESLLKARVVF